MRKNNDCAKGFTLIELLVVVLIIGILAAIALPQYQKAVEKSRVSEAKTILKALADAENAYILSTGEHATSDFSLLDIDIPTETANWEFYLDEVMDVNEFALGASRKGKNYDVLFTQGYGEDGNFLCYPVGTDDVGDCKFFGKQTYTMESTNWDVVKIP